MIIPKKRFHFNQYYIYGSAAFVVGFGAVLVALVHIAPVRVPDANVATRPVTSRENEKQTTSESSLVQEASSAAMPGVAVPTARNQGTSITVVQPATADPTAQEPTPSTSAPSTTTPTEEPATKTPAPATDPGTQEQPGQGGLGLGIELSLPLLPTMTIGLE